jgi:hypothetical protein
MKSNNIIIIAYKSSSLLVFKDARAKDENFSFIDEIIDGGVVKIICIINTLSDTDINIISKEIKGSTLHEKVIIIIPDDQLKHISDIIHSILKVELINNIDANLIIESRKLFASKFLTLIKDAKKINKQNLTIYTKETKEEDMFKKIFQEISDSTKNVDGIVLFSFDKTAKKVVNLNNTNYIPDHKNKTRSIQTIVDNPAFIKILDDLLISDTNITNQIKIFYNLPDAELLSILLTYKNRNQFIFLKNTADMLYFIFVNKSIFIDWVNTYDLISINPADKPNTQFIIRMNPLTYRHVIFKKQERIEQQALRTSILKTFRDSKIRLVDFLGNIVQYKLNDYIFYYDKVCVRVKSTSKEMTIENFNIK